MNQTVKKWTIRLTLSGVFLLGLLISFVLYPSLLYSNKTSISNYTVYHNSPLDPAFKIRLNEATELIKLSELYDLNLKMDVCLNDGSNYPKIIEFVLGKEFVSNLYNKIIFNGNANYKNNTIELNLDIMNLTQAIAHNQTHCLMFNRLGFWKSNPIGQIPFWKWEGYPEYIARQSITKNNLESNINHLLKTEKNRNQNWIIFDDNTGIRIPYYKNRLLVQYCLDIKRMNYEQLLKDKKSEELVRQEMMSWFKNESQKKNY